MNVMNMSPNDYIKAIEKMSSEVQRLKKMVEEMTENIRIVSKQSVRLKEECDRYKKKLDDLHINGDFE